ncbi:hypothetical protein DXB77_10465, partial [Clostridium sp. OM05-9]|uniref:DUF5979 domain-containing protein n=1 Tax=Clostridium sp. OM05-9 TaxID=2293045 RepID=UPI000FF30DCE
MGRKSKKVVALLLALLMVFSVCSPVSGGTGLGSTSAKAGNSAQPATASDAEESEKGITPLANPDGLTLSDFTIKVNGTTVSDDSNVKNGDKVGVSFKWAIANNSRLKSFNVDLAAQGITINDYAETELYDETGVDVGTWYIQDGKCYITLKDEFLDESEINGWANIDGSVDFADTDLDTENKGTIKIGDASFTVNVDLNESESYAGSNKSKGTVTWNPDGSITQSYEVTVTAYNGKVTLGDATETMGSALTNISNIQVNGTGYTSWSDAQAAMSGMVLDSKDESAKTAKIIYDVTVSAADVKQAFAEGDVNIFDNKFSVKYKTNKDNDKDTGSVTTGLNIRKPSLSKNGTWNTDASGKKTSITWTVKLQLGDLTKDPTFDINNVAIKDTLGQYLTASGLPAGVSLADLKLSDFTKNGDTYKFTYTTDVADTALDSALPTVLTNDVDVDFDGTKYKKTGTMQTDGKGILDKEFVKANADGTLTWKISINIPASDTITEVSLNESDKSNGSWQSFVSNVDIEGTNVINNGSLVAGNGIVASVTKADQWGIQFRFDDAYIASKKGQVIEVTIITKPENLTDGANFINHANLTYKDKNDTKFSADAEANYKYTNSLDKTGTVSTTKLNTIDYSLSINLSEISDDLKVGDVITVTDTLPDTLQFNDDAELQLKKWANQWYSQADGSAAAITGSISGHTITYSIPVTQQILDGIADVASNTSFTKYVAEITYSASVADDILTDYVKNGASINVTNNAEVSYNGESKGSSSTTNTITPGDTVKKSGVYILEQKKNNGELTSVKDQVVEYTVYVNTNAAKLANGGTIHAEDTMGSALLFQADSLHVYAYNGDGNPEKDASNWTDITSNCAYSYDAGSRTVKMNLPDGKALKLVYRAEVNQVVGGKLDASNASNSFSLTGYTGSKGSTSSTISTTVQEPHAGVESIYGSITLYKYWTNGNNQMQMLNGSVFALYKCKTNAAGEWIKDIEPAPVMSNISLGADGTKEINRLPYDQVFALYEKTADDGFSVQKEPYYFMVSKSSSDVVAPSWVDQRFNSGYLYYENKPGSFTVEKTVDGDTDSLQSYEEFTFDLLEINAPSMADGKVVYSGKSGGVNRQTTSSKTTGAGSFGEIQYTTADIGKTFYYKVSEQKGSVDGMTYDTSFYIISLDVDANAAQGIYTKNVSVKKYKSDGTPIAGTYSASALGFDNSTAPQKGDLKLEKIVSGDYTPTAGTVYKVSVKNKATNKYYDKDGKESTSQVYIEVPANGEVTIKDLPIGDYTVAENETDAAKAGYALTVTGTGDVKVTKDTTTTATVTNTYTQDKGSLTVAKAVVGYDFGAAGKNFTIYVTDANGKYVKEDGSITATKTGISVPANGSVTINDIPVGTYTVAENETDAAKAGYALTVTGTGDVKVTKDATATATVTNTYTQDKGSLTVAKAVAGYDFGAAGKNFTIYVTNASGEYVKEDGSVSATKTGISVPANGSV